MPKTVILSDCHFGYQGFNEREFSRFLDHLRREGDVTRLVLLGDVFDLWRADPVSSISFAHGYLQRLREICDDICYILGNHDYHNRVSWPSRDREGSFLGMKAYYPYHVLDRDIFLVHGDYFDIHDLKVAEKAIYAVYESIYHMDKSALASLEDYFWKPIDQLKKWLESYWVSPATAQAQPPARYLATVNLQNPDEVDELERGLDYLTKNRGLAVQMFVPTSMRANMSKELPLLLSPGQLRGVDTSPVRRILSDRNLVELAREISGKQGIRNVIYGHTHKAENRSSKGHWNTGSWVDGESTFCEIEEGQVNVYRFKRRRKITIPEPK